jgi:hypothetical protein
VLLLHNLRQRLALLCVTDACCHSWHEKHSVVINISGNITYINHYTIKILELGNQSYLLTLYERNKNNVGQVQTCIFSQCVWQCLFIYFVYGKGKQEEKQKERMIKKRKINKNKKKESNRPEQRDTGIISAYTKLWSETLKERKHSGDLDVDGRII